MSGSETAARLPRLWRIAGAVPAWLNRQKIAILAVGLCLYVLVEVNYSLMSSLAQLAVFAGVGMVMCYLQYPAHPRLAGVRPLRWLDVGLAVLSAVCCGYLVYHGSALGQRAGMYTTLDLVVGVTGLVLVLEAARRAIGVALPILAVVFIVYAHESVARGLPDWLFPHAGQNWEGILGQTMLRTEGVFGTALNVMFKYVFLFVLFGAFLQASGATGYIIGLATRLFGGRAGGPAKVSVLASGLMGSLSGSAVANAATTGTFTIPMMRSIGFQRHIAGGIEAATSSGGALVPPVMGAGAYMMLEIIHPQPEYMDIIRAALIPAILYYLSIFLLVHFYAKRLHESPAQREAAEAETAGGTADGPATSQPTSIINFEAVTFFGALGGLMTFLVMGYSPQRAATYALALVLVMTIFNPRTPATRMSRAIAAVMCVVLTVGVRYLLPLAETWADAIVFGMGAVLLAGLLARGWREMIVDAFTKAAQSGIALTVAAACVGVVIGLVSRTGIGTGVPDAIIPLAGDSLFLALLAIMGCSIVLGMGLPSAVSYLLLATIVGPVFASDDVDVPILAAHLFIFYFGMMAMVTPPVALAAYATASIAECGVMRTGLAAFRFALVGFTLPFMFVYRPELLMLGPDGGSPEVLNVVVAVLAAVLGIVSLAAAMAGYLFAPLGKGWRALLFVAAGCALFPDQQFELLGVGIAVFDVLGASLLGVTAAVSWRARAAAEPTPVMNAVMEAEQPKQV